MQSPLSIPTRFCETGLVAQRVWAQSTQDGFSRAVFRSRCARRTSWLVSRLSMCAQPGEHWLKLASAPNSDMSVFFTLETFWTQPISTITPRPSDSLRVNRHHDLTPRPSYQLDSTPIHAPRSFRTHTSGAFCRSPSSQRSWHYQLVFLSGRHPRTFGHPIFRLPISGKHQTVQYHGAHKTHIMQSEYLHHARKSNRC